MTGYFSPCLPAEERVRAIVARVETSCAAGRIDGDVRQ
jgi:hypothetical protein